MTPNGWKQLSNIWFGTLWVKLLLAMHAHCMHAWHIHATVDFEIWHFRAISRGEDLLFYLKTKAFARCLTEILVFTPRSIMPVAAFSVNHGCPFKYRTRHSKIEQNSNLHLTWRKIKKRKQNALGNHEIAKKQSLYNDLFTESRKKHI